MSTAIQPAPIKKCLTCGVLYGPALAVCSRCGGPLVDTSSVELRR